MIEKRKKEKKIYNPDIYILASKELQKHTHTPQLSSNIKIEIVYQAKKKTNKKCKKMKYERETGSIPIGSNSQYA